MADDNIRVYFYNGEWLPYQTLYDDHGITLTPSTPITLYDTELNEYAAWIEHDTGNENIWVVPENRWYSQNELPYWIKTSRKFTVYLISQNLNLDIYTCQGNELYNYNGHLQSFQYMHLGFGITLTPSEIYFVKDNIIKCWYNRDINQYWDVDTVHWYPTAPDYSDDTPGDINAIGATGIFLYHSETGLPTHYGTLVNARQLQAMCMNFPDSGAFSYTKITSVTITGTWKILTEVYRSSKENPCVVFATKVSEDATEENSTSQTASSMNSNSLGNNATEMVVYDL